MIFYFSGTGNSKYVAERIAAITGQELVSLNEKIKAGEYGRYSGDSIFVAPVYAWRMPRVMSDWIEKSEFDGGKAWFILTCGDEIGDAGKYNRRLCEEKKLEYFGTAQIVMPENYIAMYDAPDWPKALQIIEKSEPAIDRAGEIIRDGQQLPQTGDSAGDRFKSAVVNPFFYKMIVKADAYRAGDGCNGCGQCVALCPLNNIELKDGRPSWGGDCTHCMACICYCPQEAIEYGSKSAGKPRYQCKLAGK